VAFHPTDEQQAILDFVKRGRGNLLIDALAGTGKSRTVLESLKVIPQRSVLMTAFNKAIAEHLQQKLPKLKTHAIHVKTFHSLGFSMIKKVRPDLEISKTATEELIADIGKGMSFNQKRAATRLLKLLKETSIAREPDPNYALSIGFQHDVFPSKASVPQIEDIVDRASAAYVRSQDLDKLKQIDFCDMVWLPVVNDAIQPMSRYLAIIIDELQDVSDPQFALVRRVMLPNTRVVCVGDRNQSLYSWRGGLGDKAWEIMETEFDAKRMPLTMTFRCAQEIVAQANQLVPELRALPDNDGGTIETISYEDMPNHFLGGQHQLGEVRSFVLSRRNDELLDAALFLHKHYVAFQLNNGKEMLSTLFYLLDFVLDTTTYDRFETSLIEWRKKEYARATKMDAPSVADRAEQQFNMLMRCAREAEEHPTKIKGLLHKILMPNTSGVMLSSVHKVKGLEADRVFLLRDSFARYRETDGVDQEELNIEYVAITRAKAHLVWVTKGIIGDTTTEALDDMLDVDDSSLKSMSVDKLEEMFIKAEREGQRILAFDDELAARWFECAKKILEELNHR
jgi:DNA helicase-2/ATP-dependent DNA helicase PcrA